MDLIFGNPEHIKAAKNYKKPKSELELLIDDNIDDEFEYYESEWEGECAICDGNGCPECLPCGGIFSPGTNECDRCKYYNECANS